MSGYRNILLAMDFSHPAHNALEHAAVLARRSGAKIHALHVNVVPAGRATEADLPDVGEYLMALAKASRNYLEQLPQPDDVEVVNAVREDYSPVHGIQRYAEENDIDLIVMGTHGRSGLSRLIMGSVAAQTLRAASVPVLIVGEGEGQEVSPEGPRRILTSTDLSEASRPGVIHAAELARDHGAALSVVHVLVPPPSTPYDLVVALNPPDEAAGRKALEDFVAGLDLPVQPELKVRVGTAHGEILAEAEKEGADLLVLSASGHSGLQRLVLGSVADKVANRAPCPVLVHRPPQEG